MIPGRRRAPGWNGGVDQGGQASGWSGGGPVRLGTAAAAVTEDADTEHGGRDGVGKKGLWVVYLGWPAVSESDVSDVRTPPNLP